MTSRERLFVTMSGGIPDRVPCSPDTNWTIPQRLAGVPSWDIFYHEKPPVWKAYNDTVRYYGIDGFSHHGYCEIPHAKGVEEEKRILLATPERMVVETMLHTPAGTLRQEETYLRDEPPTPTRKFVNDFVKDYEAIRYLFFGQADKLSLEKYRIIRDDMGDNGLTGLCIYLPTLLTHWREPTEAAFYDYFEHHDLLTSFIEEWTDYLVRIAKGIVNHDIRPDFVFFPNSGAITMQSDDIMKEFTFPALQQLTSIFHGAGILTSLHSCGKERLLVELAATQTDLDCIDPLEIPPMGDCNLKELKKMYGKRITLKGNLHTTQVMLDMTAEGVEREARKCLEDAMSGGRFILSTGDQCGRNTPDENIRRLVDVCEIYGRY